MAKLIYDETGRLLFTEEMKKEYTLSCHKCCLIHFSMMQRCLELHGYQVDMLTTNHRAIVDTGLKYVHNDTCYPALLVIGQLIEAVQSSNMTPPQSGAADYLKQAAAAAPPTTSICCWRWRGPAWNTFPLSL